MCNDDDDEEEEDFMPPEDPKSNSALILSKLDQLTEAQAHQAIENMGKPNGNGSKLVDNVFKLITGILVIALVGLFGWVWNANTTLTKMEISQTAMAKSITQLDEDSELDQAQSASIVKHWKIHNWTRDQVNSLRHAAGEPPVSWPPLD